MTAPDPTFSVVPSPPALPPVVGLIASLSGIYLDPPDNFPDFVSPAAAPDRPAPLPGQGPGPVGSPGRNPDRQRWVGGYRYVPEQTCSAGGVEDPCSVVGLDIPHNPDVVATMPWLVWAGDKCSSFGWSARDYRGRATRALAAVESRQIASELWTGALATASGWPNVPLASPLAEVLGSGAVDPREALECLEEGIAATSNGQQGMIHCTRQLAAHWSTLANVYRSNSGLIQTYMGTIIVPDAGYDGSGPLGQPRAGGSLWAYGTLMVTVRRSPIEVIPDTFEEAVDRATNDVAFRAERLAAASFPTCTHLAIEVDLPLCLSGGAS